ncbi:MAG: glycoside hydrolase family 127 protein [Bacteroidota bacterium]
MKQTNRILGGCVTVVIAGLLSTHVTAQTKGITNTTASSFAKLQSTDMGSVQWTKGFWAERMQVCKDSMVPHLWSTYTNPKISHSFKNFEIAAGLDTGNFKGPSFHDGDFYKTLEAVAGLYSKTKDPKLDAMMDHAISVIAKAQTPEGYIYTKAIIQQKKSGKKEMFDDKLSFEAYNFGHLMTAACVHYRATGKTTLLEVAKKATDFLIGFYNNASAEQARNAICPSHYMGIVEMYRTTGEKKYLALVKKLIDIRGTSEGSDDNSDRLPFRQMTEVNGHAVRANYLFAGVADVFAETGDSSLLKTLDLMWDDVVNHKMYITGGCGALYDGLSLEGLSYKPDSIQKIQQAYGKDYQLPNKTAHNETCANIGNLLWNWRMLQVTGDAKYADIIELELYNGILSGISLNGNNFFYTNPLAASDDYPYDLRWSGGRIPYIRISNCCPPNTIRTIAEVNEYAYSFSDKGLYVNLYGANTLDTKLANGNPLQLTQQTNYPWDGAISLSVGKIQASEYSFFLRIPEWCNNATLTVNGKPSAVKLIPGQYAELKGKWKAGDQVQLNLPMAVKLMESNPLVEETRNQVAIKRGPLVYCAESTDLPAGKKINGISIPLNTKWTPKMSSIDNSQVMALEGKVNWTDIAGWKKKLYQPVSAAPAQLVNVKLIPYYAWANRGHSEMTVWMPVDK